MVTSPLISDVEEFDPTSESTWRKLYSILESLVPYFIYSSNIVSWQGQEKDILEDILQETMRRIIEHSQKATRGEALPIQSLKNMGITVAHNYCKDLARRDRRLLRIDPVTTFQVDLNQRNQVNPEEAGVENVYQGTLFKLVAREVAAFPNKQRRAILIDLANRMHFGNRLTPLQQAFLDVGINLREFQRALPTNPQEKSRHVALVSCAYKRLASLQQIQKYIASS
jgi:DNA-directed RNA polymerase specialized sigma24 family protein